MRPTRKAIVLAAAATVGGLLLAAPTVQAAPPSFGDVCERHGGTYTLTPGSLGEPDVYECEDIYLKLVKPSSPTTLFAGPFMTFQRAVPTGYSCFPGEAPAGSGWFEYVACTIYVPPA